MVCLIMGLAAPLPDPGIHLEHVGDADDDEGEGVGVQGVEAEGGRHLRVVPLEPWMP
jgi:hypothetical protein